MWNPVPNGTLQSDCELVMHRRGQYEAALANVTTAQAALAAAQDAANTAKVALNTAVNTLLTDAGTILVP